MRSMLYRFREAQALELGLKKAPERRPYLATDVEDLGEAERWRQQVVREISKKVSRIQNPGLEDHQIRDLNDEINKLIREKYHWEDQILALGGPDYKKIGPKMLDREGKEAPGSRGYRYFGRARDLPGVRELFEVEAPEAPKKTRGELYKHIDADYYGYRDEEDGILLKVEAEAQAHLQQELISSAETEAELNGNCDQEAPENGEGDRSRKRARLANDKDTDASSTAQRMEEDDEDGDDNYDYVAHVPVPTQKEVEQYLVQKRQKDLLEKYVEA